MSDMVPNEYVQYGCGLSAPATWTNYDASPTLRIQRIPILGSLLTRGRPQFPKNVCYGDITRGLPIAKSSCAAIYCSHVIEHLSLDDMRIALRNTYEYLMGGGLFRFVLPDLEHLARTYLVSQSKQPAMEFMKAADLGCQRRSRGVVGFLREWLGNSRHLWMWDYRSLEVELFKAGFIDIRRALFGDGGDVRFRDVEEEGRWKNCLGMECRKGQY